MTVTRLGRPFTVGVLRFTVESVLHETTASAQDTVWRPRAISAVDKFASGYPCMMDFLWTEPPNFFGSFSLQQDFACKQRSECVIYGHDGKQETTQGRPLDRRDLRPAPRGHDRKAARPRRRPGVATHARLRHRRDHHEGIRRVVTKLAVQTLADLTGISPYTAFQRLKRAGFSFHSETRGGYRKFLHPDGSMIWIRPSGEIMRLGPPITPKGGGKKYRHRYNQHGDRTSSHSTGEVLAR